MWHAKSMCLCVRHVGHNSPCKTVSDPDQWNQILQRGGRSEYCGSSKAKEADASAWTQAFSWWWWRPASLLEMGGLACLRPWDVQTATASPGVFVGPPSRESQLNWNQRVFTTVYSYCIWNCASFCSTPFHLPFFHWSKSLTANFDIYIYKGLAWLKECVSDFSVTQSCIHTFAHTTAYLPIHIHTIYIYKYI